MPGNKTASNINTSKEKQTAASFPAGPGRRMGQPVVKPRDLKGTLLRLWKMTKGSRKGLGWILVLSACGSISSMISPLIIGSAVTKVDNGEPVMTILLLLASLYLGDWMVRFSQQFLMATVGQKMIHTIRTSLFSSMKKLPLAFFDQRRHGELMSRLTNDVDNISNTISNSVSQLLMHAFTIIGIFAIMITLSPILTVISLTGTICIFLLTRLVTKHTRKMFSARQKILGELNGLVEETISGEAVVKAFCQEKEMIRQFEAQNEELRNVSTRALIWSGYLMPLTNVINNLNYLGIAVASGILAVKGMITVGMISSFLLYVRQFSRPFVDIANIYNNFQTAVAGAERILAIIDEQPEPEDHPDALPLDHPVGEIEFQDVWFGYNPDVPVLKGISLKIPAGTRVAIVGETGAGKTTIINLLTRFYDVTSGKILLDGHDLREYRMKDLRKSFGVVLQDSALFAATVRENIGYGCGNKKNVDNETTDKDVAGNIKKPDSYRGIEEDSAERKWMNEKTERKEKVSMFALEKVERNGLDIEIEKAAREAGASGFIERLPQKYDTFLSQGGMELSQGERQLLTIARAVLTNAPLLILDEATSSVDTVTEQKIRNTILRLTEGRTSFIIAHRLSTIKDSDLIILLENGKIAEMGDHETLMKQNGKYASMYRIQTGV